MKGSDKPICGAPPRTGPRSKKRGPCGNRAGYGTSHLGEGRCKFHGGNAPIKHGRYSKINRPRLRDLVQRHEQDPTPLDTLPELAAMRALFVDYVERYDEMSEALLAWHANAGADRHIPERAKQLGVAVAHLLNEHECKHDGSDKWRGVLERQQEYDANPKPPRPRDILDVAGAGKLLAETTKIVERIDRRNALNAVSQPDLYRIMREMARVVEQYVPAEDVRKKIAEAWLNIQFFPNQL